MEAIRVNMLAVAIAAGRSVRAAGQASARFAEGELFLSLVQVVGLLCIVHGIAGWSRPAAEIVLGLALIAIGIVWSRPSSGAGS